MSSGELKPQPIQTVKVPKPQPTVDSLADSRAAADPLPGPLLNAFTKGAIKAGEVYVRKVVAYDYVILKALDSPLHRMLLELAKPKEVQEQVDSTQEEEWDLCLQFTIPCHEASDLLEKGVEAFHEEAKKRIAKELSSEVIGLAILAIFEQVKRNAEAGNRYATEAKEGNEITFFREATV